jgi:hypothetical protein
VKKRRNFTVELFEEHEKITFYSIRFEGDTLCEFEKFMKAFMTIPQYQNDIKRIAYWIDKIAQRGALERHFRTSEGKMKDGVCAIPIEFSKLRLYCLRLSDELLILGNGGVKKEKTYNQDERLRFCVETLSKLDSLIKIKQKQNIISIKGKTISGNLSFYL